MHLSPVDPVLVIGVALITYHAARRGFVPYLTELLAFGIGLVVAFALFDPIGGFIHAHLGINAGVAGFGTFLLLLVVTHALIQSPVSTVARWLANGLRPHLAEGTYNFISAIPGFGVAAMVATLLLCVAVVVPVAGLKPAVTNSIIGSRVVGVADFVRNPVQRLLVPANAAAPRILESDPVSNPGEDAFLKLNIPANVQIEPDTAGEDKMLQLLNQARAQAGLSPLRPDPLLQQAARGHSADMYQRHYFSHKTPDGKSPYDRLHDLRFHYVTAGENIAFAPDVAGAWDSLMKSPDHRANILNSDFRCVGIGAYKGLNGYEEMFTQDFADCETA